MSQNSDKSRSTNGIFALSNLFDDGNFTEIGAHTLRGQNNEKTAVLCAYGPVCGRLTFAFAQDTEKMNGAFDCASAKKIHNLFELALKAKAPVVAVFSCAGSLINEGATLLSSLSDMFTSFAKAKHNIPTVALINGVCTGSMATAALMSDFTISTKGSEFSAIPGFINDNTCVLPSIECETEQEAFFACRNLICALPDNADMGASIADDTDMNRVTGISNDDAKDFEKLTKALSDNHSFTELYKNDGEDMKIGFMPMAGRYIGVCGLFGDLTAKGADKACRFVNFCADYKIPTLTLVNSNGAKSTKDQELEGLAQSSANLACAYRRTESKRISLVSGNANGCVLPIMASRNGACDVSFALENSCISPLSPEKAVAFLMNDKITKDVKREDLEKEYAENNANAEIAAYNGDIDFIVGIDELRSRICEAILMLDCE